MNGWPRVCFTNEIKITSDQPTWRKQKTAGVLFQTDMEAFEASRLKSLALILFGFVVFAYATDRPKQVSDCQNRQKDSFHDFAALDLHEEYIPFKRYEGKVVLVVNVATFWDYTMQYLDMNALLREHGGDSDCSLEILGFPCNQFGKQEPGKNSEILHGLKYVRPGNGYQPNFPLFKKRYVNGKNEDKIFTFLKVSYFHQELNAGKLKWIDTG